MAKSRPDRKRPCSRAAQPPSLFRKLTQAALASSYLAGCADLHERTSAGEPDAGELPDATSASGQSPVSRGGSEQPDELGVWRTLMCVQPSGQLLPVPLVHAPRPLDFVGTYWSIGFNQISPDPLSRDWWLTLRYGEPCGTAFSNLSTCHEAIFALLFADCASSLCEAGAVARRGDMFSRLDRAQLLELLGDIDTTGEALLIAAFDGVPLKCPAHLAPPYVSLAGSRVRPIKGGYEIETEDDDCDSRYRQRTTIDPDGTVTRGERVWLGATQCVAGRRPAGLGPGRARAAASALGRYFAEAARLEAASVYAFRTLARELLELGAPRSLIAGALAAWADELRHTRLISSLARGFGAEACAPEVPPAQHRSALAIALENATEGCVRETFGALLATYQARAARDPDVRRVMRLIADDETRHAGLSFRLAQWLEPRLSAHARAAVVRARRCAFAQLRQSFDAGLRECDALQIGLPTPARTAQLLQELGAALQLA